tara:strand:- start:2410 stop:2667 length:258 start_codon:yes stop_codon:yes gene_type:complete
MEEKKVILEKSEIEELSTLKQKFSDLVIVMGNAEMQQIELTKRKKRFVKILEDIQKEEEVLAKKLEEKYGQGTISLESGEFLSDK